MIDKTSEDESIEILHEKPAGYDYDNLYGLLAVPFIGLLLTILTYFLRKYHCHRLLRFLNFIQNVENNDSYGSHSTATPPIILYRKDFSDYETSQTSTCASTHYSDKEIQTSLPSIDHDYEEGENFRNSETGSNLGSDLAEEDTIYINIHEPTSDQSDHNHSTTRSGTQYK